MFTRALLRRFPVLANRNFRLLLADRLLAPMAATFSLVGVSFAVLDATRSTVPTARPPTCPTCSRRSRRRR